MKNSQQYINPIGYRRELERDSELGYWIALDRRREKALRQLNKQGGKVWPEQEKAASRQPKPTKKLHGKNFYRELGRLGGRSGHTGGFAANPELARIAGQKGGRISRRGKAKK